jgi:hypothetical protein
MNIFILDNDIKKSAQYLVDKHVVKMCLEHVQLLCSQFPKGEAPYSRTHVNHPCSQWARESKQNYEWLLLYTEEMFKEYTKRYGGKIHKSQRVMYWCRDNHPRLMLPNKGLTPFAQAMPEQYRDKDPVKAYRNYYLSEKRHIAKWKTKPPYWWK